MRSGTSFFNKTVFATDLKRFWPLTAGYTLIWLLFLPVSLWTAMRDDIYLSGVNFQYSALSMSVYGGFASAFLAGIFFAMAAFSYLTNTRATYGLHALPLRREGMYLTHYLAGLCSQLAPLLLCWLLSLCILATRGGLDPAFPPCSLLALTLPVLLFYSFGVFCMMFTGQILAAPVFYFILNFLVVGVETLIRNFAGSFLYGWSGSYEPRLSIFSPMVRVFAFDGLSANLDNNRLSLHGLPLLVLYAAAGLVFAALGLLVYRTRRSEDTGYTVAIGWARPLFKYGVAFCAALSVGQFLYLVFFDRYGSRAGSLPGMLVCMIFAGLLGYFGAEMLQRKTFRVWRSSWRGGAVVCAVLIVLGCCMSMDLFGYEGYVPKPEEVERVYLTLNAYNNWHGSHMSITNPDTLRLTTEAHAALLRDKDRQLRERDDEIYAEDSGKARGMFRLEYHLKNGRLVSRDYEDFVIYAAELRDPASPAAALTALFNAEDVTLLRTLTNYGGEFSDPRQLTDLRFTGGYFDSSKWQGDQYISDVERDLGPAEAQQLYDAVLRDVAAGRAEDSLFGSDSESLNYNDLMLYGTYLDPDKIPAAVMGGPKEEEGRIGLTFRVDLNKRMTETLSVMERLGLEFQPN